MYVWSWRAIGEGVYTRGRVIKSWNYYLELTSAKIALPSQLGLENTLTATLQRGKTHHNECSGYATKESDGEVLVILELWGMRSTPSLPSLPGPFWLGVVAPNRTLSYGLNRTNGILMLN